jgi:hypothetical protein
LSENALLFGSGSAKKSLIMFTSVLQARKTYPAKFVNRRLQFLKKRNRINLDRSHVCLQGVWDGQKPRSPCRRKFAMAGFARIYACGYDGSVAEAVLKV